MTADRIKILREKNGMTQAELAKRLEITRSSINAWEQGISIPSTQYIVALSRLLGVSTDYLLELDGQATISIAGLSEREVGVVADMIAVLRDKE